MSGCASSGEGPHGLDLRSVCSVFAIDERALQVRFSRCECLATLIVHASQTLQRSPNGNQVRQVSGQGVGRLAFVECFQTAAVREQTALSCVLYAHANGKPSVITSSAIFMHTCYNAHPILLGRLVFGHTSRKNLELSPHQSCQQERIGRTT
jgi:hypothetical protein